MFEARMAQSRALKGVVDALKNLVTEAVIDVGPDGLSLQAMDSSRVCLIAVELGLAAFETYAFDGQSTQGLGVPIGNLGKMLRCAANEDSVTLSTSGDSPSVLGLAFETPGDDRGEGGRRSAFSLQLMSVEVERMHVPEGDDADGASVVVRLPSKDFARLCKDLATLGDEVRVTCQPADENVGAPASVTFRTVGDMGSAAITYDHHPAPDDAPSQQGAVTVDVRDPVSNGFSLRYLTDFARAEPLASHVQLSFVADRPVTVAYDMADGTGSVRFYLAPKVDNSDDEREAGGDGDDE
jgi:proliferating cell nuclear antigen